MANARRDKMVPLSAPGFVKEALLQTAPVAWLWVVGVGWLLLARAAARRRALGFAFLVVLGVLAFGGGKPYYLAAAYSLAFAAGAVAVESWTAGRARATRPVLAVLVVGVGLALSPFGRPVLPVETFVRYAAALGQKPGTEERQALGRLPQFYADMLGWRAMAETVAGVVRALPPGTARRPASSVATTARPGRSSTSPASSTCLRRSRVTTATGSGAPEPARERS